MTKGRQMERKNSFARWIRRFSWLFLFLAMSLPGKMDSCAFGGSKEGDMKKETGNVVRKAHGAGRWFPGTRTELQSMVEKQVRQARVGDIEGRIVAAVAPHAGYIYSGPVAGHVFRAIQDQAKAGHTPETVVVLGFSHRGGFQGIALMDGDFMETPLGRTRLDQEAISFLDEQSPRIFQDYRPHSGEHSAENEIPFVQAVLSEASLVVAIMGEHESRTIKDLSAALTALSQKKDILVIASSDMLHDPDYNLVGKTDRETLKLMEAMDTETIRREWSPGRQTLCGVGPVLTAMEYARSRGCTRGTVVHYRNSGDDFPESRGQWVVGYGAVVFAVPEASR